MKSKNGGEVFRPSWIDQINSWVEKLRIRPWIFYIVLGILLILFAANQAMAGGDPDPFMPTTVD